MRRILQLLLLMFGLMTGVAHAETTTATVNCRSAPRPSAAIVTRIPAGSRVTVQQRSSSWALIDHSPRSCWINSKYLAERTTAEANRISLDQTRVAGRQHHLSSRRISRPSRRSSLLSGPFSPSTSSTKLRCWWVLPLLGPKHLRRTAWRSLLHHQWWLQALWGLAEVRRRPAVRSDISWRGAGPNCLGDINTEVWFRTA
jgi:hypothetical protein